MFQIHPELKSIQVIKEQIVAIIESINTPMVAASDRTPQQAKVFIVGARNPSGLFSIYIYLHLLESKECLIYLSDPPEIPMTSYHDLELEALQFAESMGFMVDNLHFRNLPPDQQDETLAQLPFGHEDLEAFARSSASRGNQDQTAEGPEVVDLSPLENGVIELEDVADSAPAQPTVKVISPDGLAKIVRLLASF